MLDLQPRWLKLGETRRAMFTVDITHEGVAETQSSSGVGLDVRTHVKPYGDPLPYDAVTAAATVLRDLFEEVNEPADIAMVLALVIDTLELPDTSRAGVFLGVSRPLLTDADYEAVCQLLAERNQAFANPPADSEQPEGV